MRARTSKAKIEQQARVSAILNKRFAGQSLADIAAAQDPPCSVQNISQMVKRALDGMPQQNVAEIRLLEAGRLDLMQNALWPQCLLGDIGAINAVLRIMVRRAQMMGLDLQPNYYGREDGDAEPQAIRVEIVGNPQIDKVRWLEDERRRLLALTEGSAPPSTTLN